MKTRIGGKRVWVGQRFSRKKGFFIRPGGLIHYVWFVEAR